MYDSPTPEELLAAVARYLRDDAGPVLGASGPQANGAALAYQARVAANMLDTVRRQGLLAPVAEAAERARLQALLGADVPPDPQGHRADLARLNQRLTDRIADGTLGLATPGLAEHLWCTTLDKLAVDQPGYASYVQALTGGPSPSAPDTPPATGAP
jgi:hypothetical protein